MPMKSEPLRLLKIKVLCFKIKIMCQQKVCIDLDYLPSSRYVDFKQFLDRLDRKRCSLSFILDFLLN